MSSLCCEPRAPSHTAALRHLRRAELRDQRGVYAAFQPDSNPEAKWCASAGPFAQVRVIPPTRRSAASLLAERVAKLGLLFRPKVGGDQLEVRADEASPDLVLDPTGGHQEEG